MRIKMKYNILALLLLLLLNSDGIQGQVNHTVYFEEGKAIISLQQLDSIKIWAAKAMADPTTRIQVYTYSNDAIAPESDYVLAGRRALLLQQCLERTGIPLQSMYIERKVNRSLEEGGCTACGEMSITSNTNFLYQNIYQDLIKEHLAKYSAVQSETFMLQDANEKSYTLSDGTIVHIPQNAFGDHTNYPVQIEIKLLHSLRDLLLHSLSTRTTEKQHLVLHKAIYINATQNDVPIQLQPSHQITIIGDSKIEDSTINWYQKEKNWENATIFSLSGDFLGTSIREDCASKTNSKSPLVLPTFDTPPPKPNYVLVDSSIAQIDKQLKRIAIRLDYLQAQKKNGNGKEKELSQAQKNSEAQLKAKKDRLLIAKEKVRIQISNTNEMLETAYYQSLANYNKKRHQTQRAYLDAIAKYGIEEQKAQLACETRKAQLGELEKKYTTEEFEVLLSALEASKKESTTSFWLKTSQMGWLGMSSESPSTTNNQVAPYRVISPISTYKVSAFLIYDNQILVGEVADQSDIVFLGVPADKEVKLLAITKENDEFLIAWQSFNTHNHAIRLDFKPQSLRKIIGTIR